MVGHAGGLAGFQHDGTGGALGKGDGGFGGGVVDGVGPGVGDADLLLTGGDGGVGHRNAQHSVLTALQGHPGLACTTDGTGGSGGVVLDGHVSQGQLRGGGGHHSIKDGLPQGVVVDGGVLVVGQRHGAALIQGDGGGQLGGLGQGDLSVSALNADLIAAVPVVRKGGVGEGGGDKHDLLLAGKAVDRAPGVVGQQAVLAGAVILPIIVLGVQTLFVHDQGVKQGLLHSLFVRTGGDNGGAVLELDVGGKGCGSLLHGGGLIGPGPPGGGGGQGGALGQGQGGQQGGQTSAQGAAGSHSNPSSHVNLFLHAGQSI